MISTDKAVKPTSMMGTTKRVAELIVQGLSGGAPNFISVRFGNVIGSNGSVIPIFKRQIAEGGPITVTHPEVARILCQYPRPCSWY
jgi:FlaA1/EpsC-like NDP-sugar epimerase